MTGARLHLPWQVEKKVCESCGDEDIFEGYTYLVRWRRRTVKAAALSDEDSWKVALTMEGGEGRTVVMRIVTYLGRWRRKNVRAVVMRTVARLHSFFCSARFFSFLVFLAHLLSKARKIQI